MAHDPYPGSTKDAVLEQRLRWIFANLNKPLTTTATLDFGSIAAQTSAEKEITIAGAAVGDKVVVTPGGGLEAGLVWGGYIRKTDTGVVRLINITASAIDPAPRSWRIDVSKTR